jgi:hypothetical protein
LSKILSDGISTCDHCDRVFDSSNYHKALSAAWVVRRWYVYDPEQLRKFGFSDFIVDLVCDCVIEQGMCHDEFLRELQRLDLCA